MVNQWKYRTHDNDDPMKSLEFIESTEYILRSRENCIGVCC